MGKPPVMQAVGGYSSSTFDSHDHLQHMEQALEIKTRELTYEKSLRASSLLYEQENTRALRVARTLLQDENDDLHALLSEDDDRIDELERSTQDMQNHIGTLEIELGSARSELCTKSREMKSLRAELESLNGVSVDSTKLLTEKLALSRDLAALGPEIDHLRSQAITHQSLLAEKLSLQRQLSTTQVELETEKRISQRILVKEEGRQEHDANVESQLEELRSELAKERKEGQKFQREMQKMSTEFEGKKAVLESRLDAFRHKVGIIKDQLKETHKELQNSRGLNPGQADPFAGARQPTHNTRKRNIAHFDSDAMIGTPGFLPPTKKSKRGSTIVGDKSAFSITPYLNRSASIAPSSPPGRQPLVRDGSDVEGTRFSADDKCATVMSEEVTGNTITENDDERDSLQAVAPKNVLPLTAKSGKSNTKREPASKRHLTSALEQVLEEHDNDENQASMKSQASDLQATAAKVDLEKVDKSANDETMFIKKKRKVLGSGLAKTLFDEEDGGGGRGGARGLFGSTQGLSALGKAGLTGVGGIRAGKKASDPKFGTFSPLKRDRRPLGHSVNNI